MASELRVDKIIPTSGIPTNGTGGVIQTVFTQFKSSTLSTTSTTFIDSGTSATITPKFATSKILIHSNFFYWFGSATETEYCCLLYTSPSPRDATLSRMPSSA